MNAVSKFLNSDIWEQNLLINLPDTDGLKIKTILRGDFSQPVTIIVHGRPGNGNELLPFLLAHYLSEQGIASLRISLYDFSKDTRNLLDTSVDTDAADIDAVIRYVRSKGSSKVFAVGHSYGGLAILKSTERLDAAVLWDPTHGLVFDRGADTDEYGVFTKVACGNLVITTSGYGYISSRTTQEFDKQLGDTTYLAKNKGYSLKVISAGKGIMADLGKMYVEAAENPKHHSVIAEAHHQFEDSDEIIESLFKQTIDWLKNNN